MLKQLADYVYVTTKQLGKEEQNPKIEPREDK